MIWSIATNLAFTEVEHFTYPNLWLVGLLFFILLMFLFLRSTLLITLTIDLNMSSLEFWLSLFAVFFAWFVAFPASIIILDFDLAIIPERLVYSPGYQRAWTFNPTNPIALNRYATLRVSLDQYLLAQGCLNRRRSDSGLNAFGYPVLYLTPLLMERIMMATPTAHPKAERYHR